MIPARGSKEDIKEDIRTQEGRAQGSSAGHGPSEE